jgi:hypothetical protein
MFGDCAQEQRNMWYHQNHETCFHSVLFLSVEESGYELGGKVRSMKGAVELLLIQPLVFARKRVSRLPSFAFLRLVADLRSWVT